MKAIRFGRFHYRGKICGYCRGNKGDCVAQEDTRRFARKIGASKSTSD